MEIGNVVQSIKSKFLDEAKAAEKKPAPSLSQTFCPHPWTSLTTSPHGSVKVCCMANRDLQKADGSMFSLSRDSLDEIWRSQDLKDLRSDLKSGVKNKHCDNCWNEEAAGRESQRVRDIRGLKSQFSLDIAELEQEIEQPRYLVLKLGNTCNLRCRTCGSHSSSKWIREEYETDPELQAGVSYESYLTRFQPYIDSYADRNPLWNTLEAWLPKVRHIDMYGGEPFLVNRQWEILAKSVAQGFAPEQTIHFNTNGTHWPEAKIELLKNFKSIKVSFSIDGIGKRFEYIRDLANWEAVRGHLNRAKQIERDHPNFYFDVCITISNFNVYYVDEIINYFDAQGTNIYLNLVHWPSEQCITVLPAAAKEQIAAKVRAGVTLSSPSRTALEHILQFMLRHPGDDALQKQFIHKVGIHDCYRKQSFAAVNPEYAILLGIT